MAKRALDFVLYVCIALVLGFLCVVFAEYNINWKWLGLLFETCCVFGLVIANLRQFWHVLMFWILLLIVFVIRAFVSILIVQHVPEVRAAWVGTAFFIETVAYVGLLDAAVAWFSAGRTR